MYSARPTFYFSTVCTVSAISSGIFKNVPCHVCVQFHHVVCTHVQCTKLFVICSQPVTRLGCCLLCQAMLESNCGKLVLPLIQLEDWQSPKFILFPKYLPWAKLNIYVYSGIQCILLDSTELYNCAQSPTATHVYHH